MNLPKSAPLIRKPVLVIDDDRAFLVQVTQVLTDAGYYVLDATDVAEGMALLDRLHTKIDLTVVDLLPGGSGFEINSAASRRPNPMKVIAITGLLKRTTWNLPSIWALMRWSGNRSPVHRFRPKNGLRTIGTSSVMTKACKPADLKAEVKEILAAVAYQPMRVPV